MSDKQGVLSTKEVAHYPSTVRKDCPVITQVSSVNSCYHQEIYNDSPADIILTVVLI